MPSDQPSTDSTTGSATDAGPRRGSLLVIFLTVFIDLLGFGIVLPLLPIYADQFKADEKGFLIATLMASFSIMQFLVAPLWGRLSDRIGRRPVLMVGLLGSVVFYALFGVATVYKSLALLFVSRIGAGIAGATISTAHAYIADTTSKEKRNQGMAIIGAAFGLGFIFGPVFAWLALPSGVGDPGPGPGYAAAALSAIALGLAIFWLPESLDPQRVPERRGWFDLHALRRALATPSIGLLLLTSFVCVVAFAGFENTLSLFLKRVRNFEFREVCLFFSYIGFVLALVQGGVVRRLAGRLSETVLASIGAVVLASGLIFLTQVTQSESLGPLFVALGVCVAGFAFITPSLNSLISRRSDPTQQGGIMGLAQSTSALGRIVGPLVAIPLFKLDPTYPLYSGAGLILVGLGLLLLSARTGRDFGEP